MRTRFSADAVECVRDGSDLTVWLPPVDHPEGCRMLRFSARDLPDILSGLGAVERSRPAELTRGEFRFRRIKNDNIRIDQHAPGQVRDTYIGAFHEDYLPAVIAALGAPSRAPRRARRNKRTRR